MRFDVFSLFPALVEGYLEESILKRARQAGHLQVMVHNIRDYATDKHHITDEAPYGGGGGMVMKPEPIFQAVESVLGARGAQPADGASVPIILLSPQGRPFNQRVAGELAAHPRVALICGRYEGVDERVREHLATDEISIGDYVLTGGELAALVIIDAVTRLQPNVLGDPFAAVRDSHATGLLEGPHYTRPEDFRGWKVPPVLLSGDHARVGRWRREQSLQRTWERRPDLLQSADLTQSDREFLERLAGAASSRAELSRPQEGPRLAGAAGDRALADE